MPRRQTRAKRGVLTGFSLPDLPQSLDPRAVRLWRVEGLLRSLALLAFFAVTLGGANAMRRDHLAVLAGSFAVALVYAVWAIAVLPPLRFRMWRYELREHELEIQHGLIVVRRMLVPLVRVQHVDTRQGPLARWFGLSSVTVATAGSTHEIPALSDEVANLLRDRISALARTARDAL